MKIAYQNALDKLQHWLDLLISNTPNLLAAILFFVASFFISKWFSRLSLRALSRFSQNEAVNKLLAKMVAALIIIAGLFAALGILNLDKTVTSLLAGAGVAGLAIGLAFQDPILNVISGVIMSFRKPFRIGDTVESNGYSGIIQTITLRSTTIKTFSGEDVIIPNKSVIQNPLVNYTFKPFRRVSVNCGVAYDSDLDQVQALVKEAIKSLHEVSEDRPIQVFFDEFADSAITFECMFWIESAIQPNYLKAKSDAIMAIKKIFDKNDINIPFPIRTVYMNQPNLSETTTNS